MAKRTPVPMLCAHCQASAAHECNGEGVIQGSRREGAGQGDNEGLGIAVWSWGAMFILRALPYPAPLTSIYFCILTWSRHNRSPAGGVTHTATTTKSVNSTRSHHRTPGRRPKTRLHRRTSSDKSPPKPQNAPKVKKARARSCRLPENWGS